ncbi:phage holin family protein [Elizabethkingia anophelis]|uniref:phage holin family protein n=1 Tax=Elizabethkingia anophelis TaxID=1117645 RepID=UPI003891DA51
MFDIIFDYIEKKIDLLKLEVSEKTVISAGFLTFLTCALIALIFFVVLFNIGLAFWLGKMMGNYSYGFFAVSGFYLLCLILIIIFRNNIKRAVANFILKSFND